MALTDQRNISKPKPDNESIRPINTAQNNEAIEMKENLKALVSGIYDLQKLRIQTGNRITMNIKSKLGQKPGMKESEMEKEAKEYLKTIRQHFKSITDGLLVIPTEKKFAADGVFDDYTELNLAGLYTRLYEDEVIQIKRLESVLNDFPIWTEYLLNIRGCGPMMAGVIISTLDPHKAKYPSSFHAYCFPKDTPISTPNGMVSINELSKGDKVYSHDGKTTKVLDTFKHENEGEGVKISVLGSRAIKCTKEHPIYVCRDGEFDFIEAGKVKKGDKLAIPKLKANKEVKVLPIKNVSNKQAAMQPNLRSGIPLNNNVAFILGLFLADGSTGINKKASSGSVVVAMGDETKEFKADFLKLVRKEFGSGYYNKTNNQVCFGGGCLSQHFREWFGHLAPNKKIPEFIMNCDDKNIIRSFVRGYITGDGHVVKKGKSKGTIFVSSSSEGLIYQMQLLMTKLNVYAALHMQKRKTATGVIRGRTINQQIERYILSVPESETGNIFGITPIKVSRRKVKREGDFWLLPVKSVKAIEMTEFVYNIHTESNTYLTQNIAVHNCGLDVINGEGRSRKKDHLVEQEYTDSNGEIKTKKGLSFNPFIKTKLIGVLGTSFIKQPAEKCEYRKIYDDYKHRLENHKEHKGKTKLHRHNMAVRYAVKRFLIDLHKTWRSLEGLPVSEPYEVAKLGYNHGKDAA